MVPPRMDQAVRTDHAPPSANPHRGRRTHTADEFAPGAIQIRSRLVNAAYDDGQFDTADPYCTELEVRNPGNVRSIRCRLYLQSIPDLPQDDIPRAGRLVDSLVTAGVPSGSTLPCLTGSMFVAATIDESRDLMLFGAMVANILGDRDDLFRRMGTYIAVNPESRAATLRTDPGWWFKSVSQTPEWKRLGGVK